MNQTQRDRMRVLLIERIKRMEGFSDKPYYDVSQWTGGYGHKLPKLYPYPTISVETAENWLRLDLWQSEYECARTIQVWKDLSLVRQAVLIEMCFNLGLPRLKKFKRMLAAVENYQFKIAAVEIIDSKTYKNGAKGLKNRYLQLSIMMESDIYIDGSVDVVLF